MTWTKLLTSKLKAITPVMVVGLVLILLGSSQAYEAFDRWAVIEKPGFSRNKISLLPSFLPGDERRARSSILNRDLINVRLTLTDIDRVSYLAAEQIRDDFRHGVYFGFGGLVLVAYGAFRAHRSATVAAKLE